MLFLDHGIQQFGNATQSVGIIQKAEVILIRKPGQNTPCASVRLHEGKWIRPRGRSTKVERAAEEVCDLARRARHERNPMSLLSYVRQPFHFNQLQ